MNSLPIPRPQLKIRQQGITLAVFVLLAAHFTFRS